jgi:hypothetical protein
MANARSPVLLKQPQPRQQPQRLRPQQGGHPDFPRPKPPRALLRGFGQREIDQFSLLQMLTPQLLLRRKQTLPLWRFLLGQSLQPLQPLLLAQACRRQRPRQPLLRAQR